jgi:hypothetical protein
MGGGCHLMELLYGREFTKAELASQPVKEILIQCLVYDNELEKEYMRKQDAKTNAKGSGDGLILGSKAVNEQLFEWDHPEDFKAIVTLLTTEEYEEIAKS